MQTSKRKTARIGFPLYDSIFDYLGSIGRLLTCDEAAKAIAFTRNRLNVARITGNPAIPFIKISKRDIRYDPGEIAKFLRARTATNTGVSNEFPTTNVDGTRAGQAAMKRKPNTGRPVKKAKVRR